MSKSIQPGDPIPDLTLSDQNNQEVSLQDHANGQALVVYFYPKDDTPGCTAEACSFRDSYEDFQDAGAKVVGISGDSVASHKRFAEKHNLNFTLLSDKKRIAEKAFGVPRNFLGLLPGRVTFVFSDDGKLVSTFNSATQATRHIKEALKALKA